MTRQALSFVLFCFRPLSLSNFGDLKLDLTAGTMPGKRRPHLPLSQDNSTTSSCVHAIFFFAIYFYISLFNNAIIIKNVHIKTIQLILIIKLKNTSFIQNFLFINLHCLHFSNVLPIVNILQV